MRPDSAFVDSGTYYILPGVVPTRGPGGFLGGGHGAPPGTSGNFTRAINNINVGSVGGLAIPVPELSPPAAYSFKVASVSAIVPAGSVAPTGAKFTFWVYDDAGWHTVTAATDLSGATTSTAVPMPVNPVGLVLVHTLGNTVYVSVSKDSVETNAAALPSLQWNWAFSFA